MFTLHDSTKFILVAIFLSSAALPARATTYFVSQSTGNDQWSGDAETHTDKAGPWKTLAHASEHQYVSGDRILLKSGDTWNEELHPKGNGTADKPIVVSSYGKGKRPVIDRQDFRKDLIGIHLVDQEGYTIDGIEFAHCLTGIYSEYAVGSPNRKHLWIENCFFHDSLLYQHYENYPIRKIGLGICLFSHEKKKTIVASDIKVKNCEFRKLASGIWTNNPDNFNKNAGNIYNFGDFVIEDCRFEEGLQWQLGMRGVAGGAVRRCVTLDVGRDFRSFNGVAGAMFARCKNWTFEDSEWGFISVGKGSGDGEAFDFESNCDHMTMRNCLFHDTEGPCFLLCCYASGPEAHKDVRMENCVLNGKASRPPNRMPRCEIINTTDWNEAAWKNCRFYLSKGEVLMRVMDPEKEKRSRFVNCVVMNLSDACKSANLAEKAKFSASSGEAAAGKSWKAEKAGDQWLQIEFAAPTAVNEFRIKEDEGSSISRYVIERWEDNHWVSCFNGLGIGNEFVAPIVGRTTTKVRLRILQTKSGNPAIQAFEAFNDVTPGRNLDASGK